jgi:hypothetical protein
LGGVDVGCGCGSTRRSWRLPLFGFNAGAPIFLGRRRPAVGSSTLRIARGSVIEFTAVKTYEPNSEIHD